MLEDKNAFVARELEAGRAPSLSTDFTYGTRAARHAAPGIPFGGLAASRGQARQTLRSTRAWRSRAMPCMTLSPASKTCSRCSTCGGHPSRHPLNRSWSGLAQRD
ncbi:MAG: hypothetical protein EOO70_07440 [Myxococcaceae bacterium]|nr:MAG: hypothetical protein EOO70_07440 [Myxococcaceae bacterium]